MLFTTHKVLSAAILDAPSAMAMTAELSNQHQYSGYVQLQKGHITGQQDAENMHLLVFGTRAQ